MILPKTVKCIKINYKLKLREMETKESDKIQKRLEAEISKTPTGELRNLLCDVNILTSELLEQRNKLLEYALKLQEWQKKYPAGCIYSFDKAHNIEKELTEIVNLQLEVIKKATE